jgi:acyl-CoA hydrolase
MTIEERIQKSTTNVFKAVFPNTTNHYDTLFGGTAMHLMDEVAYPFQQVENGYHFL